MGDPYLKNKRYLSQCRRGLVSYIGIEEWVNKITKRIVDSDIMFLFNFKS